MVTVGTFEESFLAAQNEGVDLSTLFEKRPKPSAISTADMVSILAWGSEKAFLEVPPLSATY
jgi:hypothetical protein